MECNGVVFECYRKFIIILFKSLNYVFLVLKGLNLRGFVFMKRLSFKYSCISLWIVIYDI